MPPWDFPLPGRSWGAPCWRSAQGHVHLVELEAVLLARTLARDGLVGVKGILYELRAIRLERLGKYASSAP